MDLTVVGFVIAVVGIVLQLSDAFPAHREIRQAIVLLSLGVFVGIAASAALGAKYEITGNVDRRFALLYGLAAVAALFGIIAVLVADEKRREVALVIAGCAGGIFLLSGFAVGLGASTSHSRYSTDEILLLANEAERKGQYDTALDRLKELQLMVEATSSQEAIQRRIDRIQAAQGRSAFDAAPTALKP